MRQQYFLIEVNCKKIDKKIYGYNLPQPSRHPTTSRGGVNILTEAAINSFHRLLTSETGP